MKTIYTKLINCQSGIIHKLACLIISISIFSCSENIEPDLPVDGNIAYVNFVNLGEAFLYGTADTLYRNNRLYINDSINNIPFNNYNNKVSYPIVFNYESALDIREYPTSVTNISGVVDNASGGGGIYWLPVEARDYRFIFTSRDRTYLQTEQKALDKQSYHVLYLAENIESDSTYSIIDVPIQRLDKLEGSTTVQFVNLSPDAGEVEAYRVDSEGKEILTATKPLSFGEYQSTELTISGTENTYNNILLRFRIAGGTDLTSFAVPANNSAVYTVLLRGFNQPAIRKIKKNNNTYTKVNIMSDLRTSVRRVFY